jgi:hypothetical protein
MALNDLQKQKAKEKAIAFLEKNIFNLSLVLGVDIDELTSDYEIPVAENSEQYQSYLTLTKMADNLRKLEGA